MKGESQYSYATRRAGLLSSFFDGQAQLATESFAEESLNLQLNSWGQADPIPFDQGKAINGPTFLESAAGRGHGTVTSLVFPNAVSSPKSQDMTGRLEEGLCLTLGLDGAFAGRLSPSGCDGVPHDTSICINGDEIGNSNVDLGLGLSMSRDGRLTVAPFPVEGAILDTVMETSEGLQGSPCKVTVHGRGIPVHEVRAFEKSSSVNEAHFGNVPLRTTQEIDLQLGLSGGSFSLDSDSVLLDAQNAWKESSTYDYIPVVDEGSTSARLTESGGNAVPFLGCTLALESPTSSRSQACSLSMETSEAATVKPPTSSPVSVGRRRSASALGKRRKASFGGGDAAALAVHGHGAQAASSNAACPSSERGSKKCKFKGCWKGARGASGLCIAHGGGRRCQKLNCSKGAEGRTMFCKAHGGGRRCQRLGCIKSAEGRTDFCIAHGGGRRCMYEGCSKAARGRSGLCIRHGGGKRCQREGCTRSAEGFSGLCISHGGGRRCQYPDCGKGAQGSTKFCKGHGGGRRCESEGCTKGAEGSTAFCKAHGGGKRCTFGGGTCTKSVHGGTAFCVAHGGGKRCAVSGCTKSARGRTDFCVRHGGGKRCKFEQCDKSAQGRTDYCKAHGGGKRCLWGQEGSVYNGSLLSEAASIHGLNDSCEKFARGKVGLCSAHINLLEHYHHAGLSSSIPNQQNPYSDHAFSAKHLQPHSDACESSSSQSDDEPESMAAHHQKFVAESSSKPQDRLSSPVVFKARLSSRRCVATDASRQDMRDNCGSGSSDSNENSAVNPLSHSHGHGVALPHPLEHTLQASMPCSQTDFAEIQTKGAPHLFSESMANASCSSADLEGRVHGGGHFMALCSKKNFF